MDGCAMKDLSFGEYLRRQSDRDPPVDNDYDEFWSEVCLFFRLREAAEKYWHKHRHAAKSIRGALPLEWTQIRDAFCAFGPEPALIARIAEENSDDVVAIAGDLRKVLRRERRSVPLCRVRQIDGHCLRWLMRQPGRTLEEKGGSRQTILGVVREENFDTLENRVLKDFLRRCAELAAMYLRQNAAFKQEPICLKVGKFKRLCAEVLAKPELSGVGGLSGLPQPNYALQQGRRYSRIWQAYVEVIRQTDMMEKLWRRRKEIRELYGRCRDGIKLHCSPRAKYRTPLWINPIGGNGEIFEAPVWDNELAEADVEEPMPPKRDVQIVNLTSPWDGRDELAYLLKHPNAYPFIQNPHRKSFEKEIKSVRLAEIIEKRDHHQLGDYFRALHGLMGGDRWVALVPDHWDSGWLEQVIGARPDGFGRDEMFLLWRSVAAALGTKVKRVDDRLRQFASGNSLVVADEFAPGKWNAVKLEFRDYRECALPRRASPRLHPNRFALEKSDCDAAQRMASGGMLVKVWANDGSLIESGAEEYIQAETGGCVAYLDEVDALSLIVVTPAEEVVFRTLVAHQEVWPGGMPYPRKGWTDWTDGGTLAIGEDKLSLYLLEGETRDDAPLKLLEHRLKNRTVQSEPIEYRASIVPGQGLARIEFRARFLRQPLSLDMSRLSDSNQTRVTIERDLPRRFPPVMPLVEASADLWSSVEAQIREFMNPQSKDLPGAGVFADRVRPYWRSLTYYGIVHGDWTNMVFFNPNTMSQIELLKRENVFGNASGHEFPVSGFPWNDLFSKLAKWYARDQALAFRNRARHVLRLIAWTYQNNPGDQFESIRTEMYSKYVSCRLRLDKVELTFCSNCFSGEDVRTCEILRTALDNIANGNGRQDEFRLVYNLLQFYPLIMEKVDTRLCESAFDWIWNACNTGGFTDQYGYIQNTRTLGYYLRCLLFLLHRRRYDRSFKSVGTNWQPDGIFGTRLVALTAAQTTCKSIVESLIKYMRGEGTIAGIPIDGG